MRVYLVLIASVFFWCDVVTHRPTSTIPSADYAAQIKRHWVDPTIPSYVLSKNRRVIAGSAHSGYSNVASPIPGPPTVDKREIESPPLRYHQNPEENTTAKKLEPRIHQKHERLIAKKLKFASYRRSQSLNQPKPNSSTELSEIINNDRTHENKRSKNTQKHSRRKIPPTVNELHGIDKFQPPNSVLGVIYSNNKKIIVKYDKHHTRIETFGPSIIGETNSGQANSNSVSKKKKYPPQRYGDADDSDERRKNENYDHDHEKHHEHGHRRRRPSTDRNRERLPPNINVVGDYVTNLHGSFPPDYSPWQNIDNVDKLDTTHQSDTDTENEHNGFDNNDKGEGNEQNYFENNHNQSISTENSEALWSENYGTDDNLQAEKEPLNFGTETSVLPDHDEDAHHEEHEDWDQGDEEDNYGSTEINSTQNPNQSGEQNNYENDDREEEAEDQSSFHEPTNSYPNEDNDETNHEISNANGDHIQPGDEHYTDTDHNAENGDTDTLNQKPESDSYHEGGSDAAISNHPEEVVSPANEGVSIQHTDNQHYSSLEHDDRPNYSGDPNDHDDGYPYDDEDTLYSHEGHYSENVEEEYNSNYDPTNFENDNSQQLPSHQPSNSSHISDQENPDLDLEPQSESTKPSYRPPATDTDADNIPAPGISRPEEVDPDVAPSSDEQQLHHENPSLATFTEAQPAPTRPNSPPYQNNNPRPTYTPPYDYDDDENIDDYYEEDNTVPSASTYSSSYPPEPEDYTSPSTYGDDEQPYDEEPYDEDPYEETTPSEDAYTGSYEDRQVRRSKRLLRSTLRKRRRHSISKFSKK